MGIKIIKEKKIRDYTFIDDGLHLEQSSEKKELDVRKDKTEHDFRLRNDAKLNNLKHKSKIVSGHNMQGHSPVYE
jgi:hypothetical protein